MFGGLKEGTTGLGGEKGTIGLGGEKKKLQV